MMGRLVPRLLEKLPIKQIYDEALSPAVIKIGLTLENLITATAFDISRLLKGGSNIFTDNMLNYLNKFRMEDVDNVVNPSSEIAYNVLTRFQYVECSELRDMFSNLLYSASHKEHVNKAHPSFIRIIDSLAIDEAKIIKYLYKTNRTYLIFVSYNSIKTAESGILYKNGRAMTCVEIYEELLFPNMIDFYLDNLIQLGLLHSSVNLDITTKDIHYSKRDVVLLKERLEQKNVNHDGLPDIIEGGFGRTEFCELFMEACLSNE